MSNFIKERVFKEAFDKYLNGHTNSNNYTLVKEVFSFLL